MKRKACDLLIAFTKWCVWEYGEAVPTDEQIYNFFTENDLSAKYYDKSNLIDDVNDFFERIMEG